MFTLHEVHSTLWHQSFVHGTSPVQWMANAEIYEGGCGSITHYRHPCVAANVWDLPSVTRHVCAAQLFPDHLANWTPVKHVAKMCVLRCVARVARTCSLFAVNCGCVVCAQQILSCLRNLIGCHVDAAERLFAGHQRFHMCGM